MDDLDLSTADMQDLLAMDPPQNWTPWRAFFWFVWMWF